jgi:predicted RNA-binding protein
VNALCEFTVFLENEIVFRDATYVKADAKKVLVRDILGKSRTMENCRIAEVDVASERLVLTKA